MSVRTKTIVRCDRCGTEHHHDDKHAVNILNLRRRLQREQGWSEGDDFSDLCRNCTRALEGET